MKRISCHSFLLALPPVLAALALTGCGNEVNVTLAHTGKIVLHPKYGDKIVWAPGYGNKVVQVHFLLPELCKEAGTWISQCTVNVQASEAGRYNYICKGGLCSDPEVDVGSSIGDAANTTPGVRDPEPNFQVALPCTAGTIKPSPADLPGDLYDDPVTPGKVIQWLSNGTGPVLLHDWTVTFEAGNEKVCDRSDIHDADGYRNCTIKAALPAGVYRYQAASGHCQSGYGTVTVKP